MIHDGGLFVPSLFSDLRFEIPRSYLLYPRHPFLHTGKLEQAIEDFARQVFDSGFDQCSTSISYTDMWIYESQQDALAGLQNVSFQLATQKGNMMRR